MTGGEAVCAGVRVRPRSDPDSTSPIAASSDAGRWHVGRTVAAADV